MFFLFAAIGALYIFGRNSAKKALRLPPAKSWPTQQTAALAQGRHYFFTLPISMGADTIKLAKALTLAGFEEVTVLVPKEGLERAASPYPPDWGSSPLLRIIGRWQGKAGVSPFPFTAENPATPTVWISTEEYVKRNTRAL